MSTLYNSDAFCRNWQKNPTQIGQRGEKKKSWSRLWVNSILQKVLRICTISVSNLARKYTCPHLTMSRWLWWGHVSNPGPISASEEYTALVGQEWVRHQSWSLWGMVQAPPGLVWEWRNSGHSLLNCYREGSNESQWARDKILHERHMIKMIKNISTLQNSTNERQNHRVVNSLGSGTRLYRFKTSLHHLLTVWA